MTTPPRALDLCAGAGGLSLGLQRAGFEVLGVELDPDACDTHRSQVGPCIQSDIRDFSPPGEVALVAAGVPCQPFSQAGRRGGTTDPRGRLYEEVLRIAEEGRAHMLLFENVRGLLTQPPAQRGGLRAFDEIRTAMERRDWFTRYAVLNAADYGVPQHRRRVFLLGTRGNLPFRWPTPTHGPLGLFGLAPWVTVREALALSGSYGAGRRAGRGWHGMRMVDVDLPGYTVGTTTADLLSPLDGPSPCILASEGNPPSVSFGRVQAAVLSDQPAPCISAGGTGGGGGAEPIANARQRARLLAALDSPAPTILSSEGGACFTTGTRGGQKKARKAGDTIGLAIALLDQPAPCITAREGKDGARGAHGGTAQGRGASAQIGPALVSAGLLDRPATTVDCTNGLSPAGNHERQRKAVRLSVAQLALLQSFPLGFVFSGGLTSQYRQVGNAVPPLLSEALGGALLHALQLREDTHAA